MNDYKCPKCGKPLNKYPKCDVYYCEICNSYYSLEWLEENSKLNAENKKEEKKIPCSGRMCCMNRNFEPSECPLYDECQFYTPEEDISRLDAVIEMAEKEFNITSEVQKKKLRILFNAYVAEYLAITCNI